MKIVYVINGLGMGGAEKQLCLLADKIADAGNEIVIISLEGEAVNKPVNENIKIIELRMQKNILGLLICIFKLASILHKIKPHIVHSHMFHSNIISRFSCMLSLNTSRLICSAHNKNEGGRMRMLFYRFTDYLCSVTTNVSQEALDHFIKIKAFRREKSKLIYNGIDFKRFIFSQENRNNIRSEFFVEDDETLLLSVGRLTEAKDYPNLLHALSKIKYKKIKLLIIGEGELKTELLKLVQSLGLEKHVEFVGIRHDVQKFYSGADLFVLPSRWEGFGLVVAEAMGTLCPVVATNAGGVSEVVGDDRFVVPINDSDALAAKITEVLSLNQCEREEVVSSNYKHVIGLFSIDEITSKWLYLYNVGNRNK